MEQVFLGLGGNLGDVLKTLSKACTAIQNLPDVNDFEVSNFYETTPVSDIEQPKFINAVCKLKTQLSPERLFCELNRIEISLGKVPKNKNAPRKIDIDILFFGERWIASPNLIIPHLYWQERLFVLQPLLDIAPKISVPISNSETEEINLAKLIENFENKHHERVILVPGF